ncbi:CutC family protein, partial [Ancylostoma duodenale]
MEFFWSITFCSTGALDVARCERLIQAARPAPCTLHRAFDFVKDWKETIQEAIKCGFKTILTSGQAATAMDGIIRLKKIRKEADDKINILVGTFWSNFQDLASFAV